MHAWQPQQSSRAPTKGMFLLAQLTIDANPKLADQADCTQNQSVKMCAGGVVLLAKAMEQGPVQSSLLCPEWTVGQEHDA